MSSNEAELKNLLRDAEAEIGQLRNLADENAASIKEMLSNETALEMRIILLHSQISDFEVLLEDSSEHLSEAMKALGAIRAAMADLRETSSSALAFAKKATSRVELAAGMYELASKAELSDEVELLDESQRQIAELRERLKK